MIGNIFNYTDVFLRDVTVGLLDTLESTVKYYNNFENDDTKIVDIPFYYALVGHETYLLDTFDDNVVNDYRLNSMQVDVIPRGHLTFKSANVKSEEVANPNIRMAVKEVLNDELVTHMPYVRSIPMRLTYDCTILIHTEIEAFKITQSLLNTLWLYQYFDIEYKGMIVDCVLEVPDENQIDINREVQFNNTILKKISLTIEVHTNYPAYLQPTLDTDKIDLLKKSKWYSNIKKNI